MKQLRLQGLKKSLKNIYNKNKKELFDIIIFGSAVKGKEFVGDIDIAVVFEDKTNEDILEDIRKIRVELHVVGLRLNELYKQSGLWMTLIREGFSLKEDRYIKDRFGLESFGLFTYDLRDIKNKARFSQILKGYKSESVVKKVHGEIIKPGVALVPIKHVEYFREFLKAWKVKYTLKHILS